MHTAVCNIIDLRIKNNDNLNQIHVCIWCEGRCELAFFRSLTFNHMIYIIPASLSCLNPCIINMKWGFFLNINPAEIKYLLHVADDRWKITFLLTMTLVPYTILYSVVLYTPSPPSSLSFISCMDTLPPSTASCVWVAWDCSDVHIQYSCSHKGP